MADIFYTITIACQDTRNKFDSAHQLTGIAFPRSSFAGNAEQSLGSHQLVDDATHSSVAVRRSRPALSRIRAPRSGRFLELLTKDSR